MVSNRTPVDSKARFGQFVPGHTRPLMAMIEVTNRCNMACPVCFADANHAPDEVSLDRIRVYMEQLLDVTRTPIPIQISGGEPTLREDLPEIVSLARNLGYLHIELITNGVKIGRCSTLLQELKRRGLSAVYLQFDGLKKETHLKLRGQDMTEVRQRAIETLRFADLCCTLAVTVTRGINEDEIGQIVRFGIDNLDTVRAISFQSATRFTGRFDLAERYSGYSLPDLIQLIEAQSGIPADTFHSEHTGHPLCNASSLVFLVNGKLRPLFRYISSEDIQLFLGENSRVKILDLFAGKREFFSRHLSKPSGWKLLAKAATLFGPNPLSLLQTKHLLLFAKSFMEPQALDPERVKQCCYAISGELGVFSLCAFNNLYRFPHRHLERGGKRIPASG